MSARRRATDYPLRKVERAELRGGSRIFGSFKYHFWTLHLECGHEVDRDAKREPGHGTVSRGFAAMHHPGGPDTILPAPKRARCTEGCPPVDHCEATR